MWSDGRVLWVLSSIDKEAVISMHVCVFVSLCVQVHQIACRKPVSTVICLWQYMCEGRPHRRWSWGLHSLHRPRGGWRCCGSCSSPPAWSSWPSWPLRWLRWQLLPPLLSGLERGGRGDRALTDHYVSAGAEPLHLQNLSGTCAGK